MCAPRPVPGKGIEGILSLARITFRGGDGFVVDGRAE